MAVPLDRSGSLPGTITLSVERRLAGGAPSASAVVAIAGGPGQAANPLGVFIAEAMAPALGSRDLLVFDQRGTGESGALSCAAVSAAEQGAQGTTGQIVERCARELGAARADYTTLESVADIEALRQAAGYPKLVLYGTSYGTKVALQYAERYPQNVEALVLDSTETPEGPEAFRLTTFKAMTPALDELCAQGACRRITRNPVADVARLVARLSVRPLRGHAYDDRGRAVSLSLTGSDLYGLLLAGDLDPALRAELPAAVHSALARDPGPLLRLVALGGVRPATEETSDFDLPLFINTSCEETQFPWRRDANEATRAVEAEAAVNALPDSDFYPFNAEAALLDQTIPLCLAWPNAAPPPPAAGSLPNVPTLILSGAQDLRTPTENARTVAKRIPDAQVLTIPYTGHSVIGSDLTGCAKQGLAEFFGGAPVAACHASNRFPPVATAPRSLSALSPAGRVAGVAGRTLAATVASIRDARRTIVLLALSFGRIPVGSHFGGLRGGAVKITKTAAVLDRYSYVPGVQVSGSIPTSLLLRDRGRAATLTVTGAAAAHGRLRISATRRVVGVLGGHRLAVHLPAPGRSASAGRVVAEWPSPAVSLPLSPLARQR